MKPEITRPQRTRWPHARSIPRRTGSLVGKQQTAVRGAHPINLCLQVPRVNGGCASIVSFEWAGRDRRVWRRRLVRRSDYRKARSSSPTSTGSRDAGPSIVTQPKGCTSNDGVLDSQPRGCRYHYGHRSHRKEGHPARTTLAPVARHDQRGGFRRVVRREA
jgi:hypothetical protein